MKRIWNRLFGGRYAIIDPRDSSLTMSRRLWKEVEKVTDREHLNTNRVYVFKAGEEHAFCIDTKQFADVEDAAFSPIQLDTQTKHVGFALTRPTGAHICLDYSGQVIMPIKVRVRKNVKLLADGEVAWEMRKNGRIERLKN